ncbi:MAG TPA: hypothetical protein VF698_05985 [Thermoanaerobaculia bacterium]
MKNKYKRYTLKGDVGEAAARQTLGQEVGNGHILRIHSEGGETHVYVESFGQETHGATAAAEGKEKGGYTSEEVTLEDVTDLSPRKR